MGSWISKSKILPFADDRKHIMKKVLGIVLILSGLIVFYFSYQNFIGEETIFSPLADTNYRTKPLEKYAFDNLKKRSFLGSRLELGKKIKDDRIFSSYLFYFYPEGKKVSGLINIPKTSGKHPILIMFRGDANKKGYITGFGTNHAGQVFARNGFITIAPDFLGFGESASSSSNLIEERFENYLVSLNLIPSLKNINQVLDQNHMNARADLEKIGIWGHSNGGHMALVTLEITGEKYPTSLWAPVSKFFPYSILYDIDSYEDQGRQLRRLLADFEADYQSERYSPPNFFDWINAPIILHHGGKDDVVAHIWSDDLYQKMKKLGKQIVYHSYPQDDHNFSKGSWAKVVARDISFYKTNFNAGKNIKK